MTPRKRTTPDTTDEPTTDEPTTGEPTENPLLPREFGDIEPAADPHWGDYLATLTRDDLTTLSALVALELTTRRTPEGW